MVGGPSAASSLYSGIFDKKPADANSETLDPSAKSPRSGKEQEGETESTTSLAAEKAVDKPQAWSAALRFAPRKNISKAKRPLVSSSPAVLSAAFASPSTAELANDISVKDTEKEKAASVQEPSLGKTAKQEVKTHALTIAKDIQSTLASLPVVTAPPSLFLTEEEIEEDRAYFRKRAEERGERKSHDGVYDDHSGHFDSQDGVYYDRGDDEEDDVNGFMSTVEGKRAAKKKHKRKRNGAGLSASLNMDADYDVRIPNDFFEFKELLRRRKEAEQRYRNQHSHNLDETEDPDNVSSEIELRRERKVGRFAPPASYGVSNDSSSRADDSREHQAKPSTSEEHGMPFFSSQSTTTSARPPGPPPRPPPVMLQSSHSLSGEEAYQRRLAMSQAQDGPPDHETSGNKIQGTQRGETCRTSDAAQSADDFAARTAAAAAIAAQLGQLTPSSLDETKSSPDAEASIKNSVNESMSFAERLMMKQGWRKGDALGAEGNKGILDPLLAHKVHSQRTRHDAHPRESTIGSQSARGTIVNAREDDRRREERMVYGEASEIILLENMLASDDDIDDDLTDEIGEECAKHGYVKRVFVWPASSSSSSSRSKPRIFVQFTGMAGAWRCLKDLDGRFFAGNTVRARYYPSSLFAQGEYDQEQA